MWSLHSSTRFLLCICLGQKCENHQNLAKIDKENNFNAYLLENSEVAGYDLVSDSSYGFLRNIGGLVLALFFHYILIIIIF